MDKMREEFEKEFESRLDLRRNKLGYVKEEAYWAFEGYQAATKEAERYREALQEIERQTDKHRETYASMNTSAYYISRDLGEIAKQALQKRDV